MYKNNCGMGLKETKARNMDREDLEKIAKMKDKPNFHTDKEIWNYAERMYKAVYGSHAIFSDKAIHLNYSQRGKWLTLARNILENKDF